MTKDGAYIVSYTNAGFSPKTVTIKVGKAVHFVNNSSKAMSVTTTTTQNQVQSELNQGKTVGQGGTYDFTFTAPGTWVYMNRNAQTDYGTIIVQ
jgi:plastocyanin